MIIITQIVKEPEIFNILKTPWLYYKITGGYWRRIRSFSTIL